MSGPPMGDLYLDEPWLSVRWNREHNYVHSEWKGFANSLEFRKGTMRTLDAIRDRHATSLVSDTRRLEVVIDEDQQWMRDTWVPMAVAAGLKRIALVVAHQGLGRFAVHEIVTEVGPTAFVTRMFDALPAALEWVVTA